MYEILFYVALFIGIIPLLILILKKRAFDFKEPIAPFVWLTALATLYELVGTVLLKLNTAYWFQIYSFLEIVTLGYFFFKLFQPKYKTVFQVFLVLLIVAYCVSFFFWGEKSKLIPNAINKTSVTLFVLAFSFLWYKTLYGKREIYNPLQQSVYYFVLGFSIYYAGTFFLFLLSSPIFNSNLYFYNYWLVNILATFILRILLITGVWKLKQD